MGRDKCVEKITETLVQLEKQGEIVITSALPEKASEVIFESAIKSWVETVVGSEEPIEISLPYLLERIVSEIVNRFSVENSRAKEIANEYYKLWLKDRSMKEIAEIYWHETPQEIAKRAYYAVALGKEDTRDLDYLEWRKKY